VNLDLALLRILRAAGELLTPEPQLRCDLRLTYSPPPTGLEISDALNRAEDAGWAVSVRDPVTGQVRWQVTDLGRVQLSKRGL
jgi:hypothetical protein